MRDPREELGAAHEECVTRLCRCEPLLSNQSNKWDELRQVRLSARSADLHNAAYNPLSLGVTN